jgi:transposase InsO family protein
MRSDIDHVVHSCEPCQRFNLGKHSYHPLKSVEAALPWDHIAIDLVTSLRAVDGFKFLLVVVDVFSRFTVLRALKDKTATSVARALWDVFGHFGVPLVIQSDNGTEFANRVVNSLTKTLRVDHRFVAAYHPRANGLVERTNGTVMQVLKKTMLGRNHEWVNLLPLVQLAVNANVASTTGTAPFPLMFGRPLREFADHSSVDTQPVDPDEWQQQQQHLSDVVWPSIAARSTAIRQQRNERFNDEHRILPADAFPAGSWVRAKDPTRRDKLEPLYEGPYQVVRQTTGGAYILRDSTGVELPRKFAPVALKTALPPDVDSDPVAEVDFIVDHDGAGSDLKYLVRWVGYKAEDDTWVKARDFETMGAIRRYWRDRESNQARPRRKTKRSR